MGNYRGLPEEIGSFEAKTRLSELLRETERGKTYLINRRGRPIARLVPPEETGRPDFKALAAAFRDLRSKLRGRISVRRLIEEGRR